MVSQSRVACSTKRAAGVVPGSSQNFLEDDEGDDDRDIWTGHTKQVEQGHASKVDQRRRVNDAH